MVVTRSGAKPVVTSVGPHELALVSPQDFSVRMRKHWSETLNMPTPPTLIDVHRLMAEEFQRIIINNATNHDDSASVVLPLPTGSGKTQGTCLYSCRCVCFHIKVKCLHGCQLGAAWYKAGPTKLEQQWLELRRSFAASGLRTMYGK